MSNTQPENLRWPDVPETIYLQVYPKNGGYGKTFAEHAIEATWERFKIYKTDIEYVRMDKYRALQTEVEKYRTMQRLSDFGQEQGL